MLFTKAHKLVLYFILGSIYLESNRAEIKGVDYFWGIKSRKTQEACTESVNCIGNPFYCYWLLLVFMYMFIYVCVYADVCTVCMVCVHVCM